jgi:hypothetical protein
MKPPQAAELIHLLHAHGPGSVLAQIASDADMYAAPGPKYANGQDYGLQATIALIGLSGRPVIGSDSPGVNAAFLQILRTLSNQENIGTATETFESLAQFLDRYSKASPPQDAATWPEFTALARRLAGRLANIRDADPDRELLIAVCESAKTALNSWADALEGAIATSAEHQRKSKSRSRAKTAPNRR